MVYPIGSRLYVYVYVCVCMCVCVIYVYSTLNIFQTIPVVEYLCLTGPLPITSTHQLRCIPCYTTITIPQRVQLLDLILSYRPLRSPFNLTLPRRKKRNHRPILQQWLLLDARPFVARAAGEQAVRPHYF